MDEDDDDDSVPGSTMLSGRTGVTDTEDDDEVDSSDGEGRLILVKAVAVPAEGPPTIALAPPAAATPGGLISLGVLLEESAADDGADQMDTTDMDITDATAS